MITVSANRYLLPACILLFATFQGCRRSTVPGGEPRGGEGHPLTASIRQKLEAARDAREPTTYEDLELWLASPQPAQNAAPLWTNAFAALRPIISSDPIPADPWERQALGGDAIMKSFRSIVERNELALKRLTAASKLPECRYTVPEREAGHLPPMWSASVACHILEAKAVLDVANNQTASAAKDVEIMEAVVRTLQKEPYAVVQAERWTNVCRICRAVEAILNRTVITDQILARLSASLGQAGLKESPSTALIGERCYTIRLFEHPSEMISTLKAASLSPEEVAALEHRLGRGQEDADYLFYLQCVGDMIEAGKRSEAEFIKSGKATMFKLVTEREKPFDKRPIYSLCQLDYLAGRVPLQFGRAVAMLGAAEAAVAIERYRRAGNGEIPKDLHELVPKFLIGVPTDPFGGEPLRLKRDGSGYAVYSLGPNGRDDGAAVAGLTFALGDDIGIAVSK